MIRKIILAALIVLVGVLVIVFYLRNKQNRNYIEQGEELVSKVEFFRKKEGRLPNSVLELGIKESMNSGPYYEKKDSVNYIVFFNIGFDYSKIYYSKTKKWQDEP